MTFRFLHLADLHLETHFGGRPAAKERLRRATLEAFRRAVDHALAEELHAVLVAGDLYDDPLLSLRTELELVKQVKRLAAGGVWFLAACGNHDPGGPGRRAAKLGLEGTAASAPWLDRVHLFRKPKPQTVVVTDRGGAEVGVVVGAGHATEREERDLAAGFTKLDTELPVVGLLHTQVETARSAENHDRYAPSTAADYERLPYAYWALGHVHLRQRAVADAPVWYAGNLQGRNVREAGPKGGLVVEARGGERAEPTFVPFAPVRWELLRVDDLASIGTLEGVAERLARAIDELDAGIQEELAVRLELDGFSPLAARLRDPRAQEELEDELLERTAAIEVQVRARQLRRPRDLDAIRSAPSVLQKALELLDDDDEDALLSLAPSELAGLEGDSADRDARLAYLRRLARGLDEALVERCIEEAEA